MPRRRTREQALRHDLAMLERAIDVAEPQQLSSLVREHRAVLDELEKFTPAEKPQTGVGVDDIAKRRAARAAGAASSDASALR